jgi:hypothetical protein
MLLPKRHSPRRVAGRTPTIRIVFDPLRQFLVTGSDRAHRLFSVRVVDGFGS